MSRGDQGADGRGGHGADGRGDRGSTTSGHGPARVALIEPGTRPELATLEARIAAARGRVSPLYQALLHSPPVAAGWEALLGAVRHDTLVAPDLRELVILRVAVLNGAAFEFDVHAPIAARAGVSAEKLAAVRRPEPGAPFDAREQLVLALTDAMTRDVALPEALGSRVAQAFAPRELVELVTTVAAYNMVSRVLVALRL